MKKKDITVEIRLYVECKENQRKDLELRVKEYFLEEKEYTLNFKGYSKNYNEETEFYIVMNTEGSYESNLVKLKHLHMVIEDLLKDTSMKYKGISLIPNRVKWN